jgi:hypothetical protein
VAKWEVSKGQETSAAGELLFRAEGCVVAARRQWRAGTDLYARSLPLGCYVPSEAVDEGLSLIRRQLPLMGQIRLGHHIL